MNKLFFILPVLFLSLTAMCADTPANCGKEFKITCLPSTHFAKIGDTIEFTVASETQKNCRIVLTVDRGRVLKHLRKADVPYKLTYKAEFAGFIRCEVFMKNKLAASCAVAVEPENIRAAGKEPADFDEFWNNTFKESDKLPLDLKMEKLDLKGNFNFFRMSCANINGKRAYALLAVPKNVTKPVPMLVTFGGGEAYINERSLSANAQGVLRNLKVSAAALLMLHLPPYPPEKDGKAAQKRHREFLKEFGYRRYIVPVESKETFYVRPTVTGALRLLDAAAALPEIDEKNIVFRGASHGGKIGAYLACFSKHIKAAFCGVPSSCEFHAVKDQRNAPVTKEWKRDIDKTLPILNYFDLVWLAPRIKVPLLVSVGFVDDSCPPTGVYAFYNELKAPKKMYNKVAYGHGGAPDDYHKVTWDFLIEHINK